MFSRESREGRADAGGCVGASVFTIQPQNEIRPVMTAADAAVVFVIFSVAIASAGKLETNTASLRHTAWAVHEGNQRVVAVQVALSEISFRVGPTEKAPVDCLAHAVVELDAIARELRARASGMQSHGNAYIRRWERELAAAPPDEVQVARGSERMRIADAQFGPLQAGYVQAAAGFGPLLAELRRIRTALAQPLTHQAVDELTHLREQVQAHARSLRDLLDELEGRFKALGQEFGELASPPPQAEGGVAGAPVVTPGCPLALTAAVAPFPCA